MTILPLFIAIPLGAAFILAVMGDKMNRLADAISVVVTAILLALAWSLVGKPAATYWMGNWTPQRAIGINMVCDGLSVLLMLVVSVISFLVTIFSISYMERFTAKGRYYSLLMLMISGMNGVVLSGDLFNVFVFVEVASLASYALVAFGTEHEELEASFKYLVLGSVSSSFILFAVAIVYGVTGTLNMAQVAQFLSSNGSNRAVALAFAMMLMGFGLKSAMVPFHAWLPDAHPSAPAPISAMLSGLLIKALGVYAMVRVCFSVFDVTPLLSTILMTIGALSMVVGVFLAVGQWDFKRLLAYHSISQMGYVVLGIGIGASVISRHGDKAVAALAILGGLFHLVNHASFKSLLFLCSGAIEYATGTRQLKELGGLVKRMPLTSAACRIAALSISGIPPFNGFWSKLIIIIAAVQAHYYGLAAITVLVSFMTLVSFVKIQRYILGGEVPSHLQSVREVAPSMCFAMAVLAILCTTLGLMVLLPGPRESILTAAGNALTNRPEYIRLVLGG